VNPPRGSPDRRVLRRGALLLAGLTLLNYWPMLFGRVPFPADLVTQFPPFESVRGPNATASPHAEAGDLVTEMYPWKLHTRRAALEGTFPLWNRHSLLGTTFVGDPQPALFYPPTLLYALLPTPLAWSLQFLLRTVLAGLFVTLLAHALGAEELAALAAGVVFAFSGWVTAFQTRPHLDTVTWLALALFAIDRLRRRISGPRVALTAAALSLPVLAGQPESAAHVTLVALAFFLFRFALPADGGPGRFRFAAAFAISGLLALGLAAVQALPALEFIGQLNRGMDARWGPRPLSEIVAFLSRDLGSTPNSAGVAIPEAAAYAGILTLLVAPLALLHRNRRDAIFLLALLVTALSIAYGVGPLYGLSRHVPVLRGIPNGRLLAVADLSLAVLASLGISALSVELRERRHARPAFWVLAAGAVVIAGSGIALIRWQGRFASHTHALVSLRTFRGPASSAAILLAAVLVLVLALAGRLGPARFAALALAFVAADLVTASFRFLPFVRPSEIFPAAPTFEFLKKDPEPHRVSSVDGTYPAGAELAYGLESATGFNVIPWRTESLLATLGTSQGVPAFQSQRIVEDRSRLLDLMNVKYLAATTWNRSVGNLASQPDRFRLVFADGSVRVFENRTVLPRAFLVPAWGIDVAPSPETQRARVTSAEFDPARSVVLAAPAPVPFRGEAAPELPPGVSDFVQRINDVRLTARVAEPSILVLSQAYDPGWRVAVDGAPAPVLRVDYAFDGVALAPGRHTVRFLMAPRSLRIGALITAVALLVTGALAFRGGARRQVATRGR